MNFIAFHALRWRMSQNIFPRCWNPADGAARSCSEGSIELLAQCKSTPYLRRDPVDWALLWQSRSIGCRYRVKGGEALMKPPRPGTNTAGYRAWRSAWRRMKRQHQRDPAKLSRLAGDHLKHLRHVWLVKSFTFKSRCHLEKKKAARTQFDQSELPLLTRAGSITGKTSY